MKSQVVILSLICLRLGNVGTYPIENKFATELKNDLKNKIIEFDLLEKLLSFEKELKNVYALEDEYDISGENSPCINLGNDGCLNGYIIGSGGNKGFLGGAGSPGK
ncbi:uncharacterized protein LOC129943165 [Eupeodes corollae]|uniref:uncharacterized protein LOC129943165 n=1 Tax=Eupeodes corollae TaxID=290404 RepID=UPI00249290E9|nr:uncharacterized protein LOC129943165 [Eupeodes corollae]